MIRFRLTLTGLLLLTVLISGCSMIEHPTSAIRRMKRLMTPNPTDFDEQSDEDTGEWDFVGDEGRGDQTRERDPDPWFKKWLMSEKANSIERNLGID